MIAPDKPRRRWFRFNLRSLLLVVALVAVALGWISWRLEGARQQRLALRDLGPWSGVIFDMPQWFHDSMKTPAFFETNLFAVTELDFAGNGTTNHKLSHLARLPKLRRLDLNSRLVTDEGLQHLVALKELQSLSLVAPQVTDSGLLILAQIKTLQKLRLVGDTFQLTDAGVQRLRQDLPNCEIIREPARLQLESASLTDEGLAQVIGLKNVEHLILVIPQITDSGIRILEEMPRLRGLWLDEVGYHWIYFKYSVEKPPTRK